MKRNKSTRKVNFSTGTIFVSEEEMRDAIDTFSFDIQCHIRLQTFMELRRKIIKEKRNGKFKKGVVYFTVNLGSPAHMWFFSNDPSSAKSFFELLKTLDKYTF